MITVDGQAYRTLTLHTARKLGIAIVHQQILSLNERFSVAENLFLTTAPFHRLIWRQKTVRAVTDFLARYHVTLDPQLPVDQLKISDRIFVEILKQLYARPRLLILDEALENSPRPRSKMCSGCSPNLSRQACRSCLLRTGLMIFINLPIK